MGNRKSASRGSAATWGCQFRFANEEMASAGVGRSFLVDYQDIKLSDYQIDQLEPTHVELLAIIDCWRVKMSCHPLQKGISPCSLESEARRVMENEIRNCTIKFQCPKLWSKLAPTDDPNVRFCEWCFEQVYLAETEQQLIEHAAQGRCVAMLNLGPEYFGLSFMGEVSLEPSE